MAGADAVIATRVNRAMEVVTQDRITRNVPILVRLRQQRGNSSAEVRRAGRDSKFRLHNPFLDRTQEQLSFNSFSRDLISASICCVSALFRAPFFNWSRSR